MLPPFASLRQRVVMPRLNRPDLWLLVATALLAGLGIVMVFNASYFFAQDRYGDAYVFFRKQVFALGCGATLLLVISHVRLEWFERMAFPLMICTLIALTLVLVPGIGVTRGGARRWVGVGSFSFQPSEFAKIAVVLYLARSISRKRERMNQFTLGVLPHLMVVGLCALLIVRQPDFGTAAILVLVLVLMLFGGGARPSHLIGLALAVLPVVICAVVYAPYRMRRILAFLDPWSYSQDIAFQLVQSLIAFGSGGLTGVGLGESQQKMFFLPEAHTDFLFALIGEELGVCGALLVLGLFAVVGMRGFRVAMRHPDPFASLLAFGITLVILLQAVVNVGVVVGLLPTKGLALPFLSYGGSALIGVLVQVGILSALSRMTG
ncbi:MAG TPA: putative lipid II flippase FtsW [Candidatus Margulisiibacteriota bacterium]|nr:putative lipid II flippase FtsW [Candidatus Margulisiibacteriota bacterium]